MHTSEKQRVILSYGKLKHPEICGTFDTASGTLQPTGAVGEAVMALFYSDAGMPVSYMAESMDPLIDKIYNGIMNAVMEECGVV